MKGYLAFSAIVIRLCFSSVCFAQMLTPHPVPDEFKSDQYTVEVNGKPIPVFQASPRVHFVSFDFTGDAEVKVIGETNREKGVPLPIREGQEHGSPVWQGEAVVRPSSRKIEVASSGAEATFTLGKPGQYVLEGGKETQDDIDNKNMALFVFANKPERDRPEKNDPNVIFLEAGIHQQNIDLESGQTLYLAAGAVLFGSIDVYDAKDVKILGRGVIYHHGPQSENSDNGYWRKRDWHPMTTRNVEGLTVSGVTFVARSRTWTIQMHTTYDADFDNVKVFGINDQNINGDGFDWVAGGGRTTITNSLIRSADDAFAIFTPRGSEPEGIVKDILIDNCVIWPTRANVFRAHGYTDGFVLRNSDIIHVPATLFNVPRALLYSINAMPRQATLSNLRFENLRFEEPAALLGLDFEGGKFSNIVFKDISMQGEPAPLYLKTAIDGILFDNVILNGKEILDQADLDFELLGKDVKNMKFSN